MSALTWVFWVAGFACAFAWVASLVSGDTSWVDRLWSILPAVYLIIFAAHNRFDSARLDVMAALVTLWGVRLTFNFARKGGYLGVEDYRWQVLRESMSRWQFQLFNLFFIVLYQNALLVLIALPAYSAEQHRNTPFGALDVVLTLVFLGLLLAETVADQQQWNFHQVKRRLAESGRLLEPGFLREGLFRYSRHPNYFFEIAQWWVVFAFAALAARSALEWTVLGPVLLTALFIGSTRFTEKISAAKYPLYARYQREVSAIVPWRPRRGALEALPDASPPEPGYEPS
jgi:steroid 5-alpha reductase family enzyme